MLRLIFAMQATVTTAPSQANISRALELLETSARLAVVRTASMTVGASAASCVEVAFSFLEHATLKAMGALALSTPG